MNKDLKEIKGGVSDGSWDEAFIQPGNWRKPGSPRPSDDLKAKLIADLRITMEVADGDEYRQRNSETKIDVGFAEEKNLVLLAEIHPEKGILRRGWIVLFPDHLDEYDWAYLKSWFKDTVEYGPIWDDKESAE